MKGKKAKDPVKHKARFASNLLFVVVGMALMGSVTWVKPARKAPAKRVQEAQKHIGPWGELEYTYFALRQPDEYLPATNDWPAPAWHFEQTTPDQLRALFNSVETAGATRQMLLDSNRWQVSGDAIIVKPTTDLLLNLGPSARQRIYNVLGQWPVNMPQCYPFRFRAEVFEQSLVQNQIQPANVRLIRSLTYTNAGGAICLADLDVLHEKLGPTDFRRLSEILYGEPSLFLSLRIKPGTDIEQLARYWGTGGRLQEVRAVLKSVASSSEGASVNIAYLLPSFARTRLYTFPPATNDIVQSGQDCFWTALNFFRTEGEAQVVTGNRSLEILMSQHNETLEPPRFGDVVVLLENRKPVHACVYIADDVVFTKNGANFRQPWVLMKLNDLMPRYASDRRMAMVVLRAKST